MLRVQIQRGRADVACEGEAGPRVTKLGTVELDVSLSSGCGALRVIEFLWEANTLIRW